MFRALIERLTPKPKLTPGPSPLELARIARRNAAEAYAKAAAREDSRDTHWALKAYRKATNDVLRLEKAEGAR